ncbi:glycosyltransferase family A protein [Providencia hangzhouensis]|uniref:glycosyltransferase family A protein n=1 Tax=Providencia hangzhouensis TaxID=3031799 RepID=UPI0039798F64
MKLDMIYSTFGDCIYSLIDTLPEQHDNVKIIIIHQTNNISFNNITEKFHNRNDIKYIDIKSIGVAKSRNKGIDVSSGDIILFCDDDVIYNKNIYTLITQQYTQNPQTDFITFQYSFLGHTEPAPKFKKIIFSHNYRTILSIGTIEITCRREALLKNKIYFPEDMGAGTKYFLCDEPVFLSNFIKNNLNGISVPKIIGSHPVTCSGDIFNDRNAFISRRICFNRIFGKFLGPILYLVFIFKNIKKFNSVKSFMTSLSIIRFNGN